MSSNLYRAIVTAADRFVPRKLRPVWEHPAGPKTVFFWAPVVKAGLVLAGIGDLLRPAENISIRQSSALALTGMIWSRNSVVIIPKNYFLCFVNLFVASTGIYQVSRVLLYQRRQQEQEKRAMSDALS